MCRLAFSTFRESTLQRRRTDQANTLQDHHLVAMGREALDERIESRGRPRQPPPTLRGVRERPRKPRDVAFFQGCSVWCFGARLGTAATTADGAVSSTAAAARAVLARASSFSRQHCLYLRPEPHGQGSLRPGRPIVRAVIERVYTLRRS